jgi:hypothetical protein
MSYLTPMEKYLLEQNNPQMPETSPSNRIIGLLINKNVHSSYQKKAEQRVAIQQEEPFTHYYNSAYSPFRLPQNIYDKKYICDTISGQSFLFAHVKDNKYLSFRSKLVTPNMFFLSYLQKTTTLDLKDFNHEDRKLHTFKFQDSFILQKQTLTNALDQNTIIFDPTNKYAMRLIMPRLDNLEPLECISKETFAEIQGQGENDKQEPSVRNWVDETWE